MGKRDIGRWKEDLWNKYVKKLSAIPLFTGRWALAINFLFVLQASFMEKKMGKA